MATSYTEELQSMLEEVTLRGNPNKRDVARICSVLFRLNERLNEAESEVLDLQEEIRLLKNTAVKPARGKTTKEETKKEETTEE